MSMLYRGVKRRRVVVIAIILVLTFTACSSEKEMKLSKSQTQKRFEKFIAKPMFDNTFTKAERVTYSKSVTNELYDELTSNDIVKITDADTNKEYLKAQKDIDIKKYSKYVLATIKCSNELDDSGKNAK